MADLLDWDEFRVVRAIAETLSLAGAAERLGLNHSTLFRRLAATETRLGVKLFERERGGYRPTLAGEDMAALATLMGDTIAEFERRVAGAGICPTGVVRLSAPFAIGELMTAAIVARLSQAHPGLHIALQLTVSSAEAPGEDADVAICALKPPLREGLVGRLAAPLPWAIYAAAQQAEARAPPWIFPHETFGPPLARRWLERNVEPWRRAATVGGYLMMAELAARGLGVALLPCFVGLAKPQLKAIGKADPEIDGEVWVVARQQALRASRVRAVFDFVAAELERRRAWFAGEAVVDP